MKKIISLCLSLVCVLSSVTPCFAAYKAEADETTNWMQKDGSWYILDDNNEVYKGWYRDEHLCWYMLDYHTGDMKTGWVAEGSDWYYMGDNGIMKTGWQDIAGEKYYLLTSGNHAGAMVSGNYQLDDIVYTFDDSGRYIGERQLTEAEKQLADYQQKANDIMMNAKSFAASTKMDYTMSNGVETIDMLMNMDMKTQLSDEIKMSMEMDMQMMDESMEIDYYLKDNKLYLNDGENKVYIDLGDMGFDYSELLSKAQPMQLPLYKNVTMSEKGDQVIFTMQSEKLTMNDLLAQMPMDDFDAMFEGFDFTLNEGEIKVVYLKDGTPVSVEMTISGKFSADGETITMDIAMTQEYDDFNQARVKYPSLSGYQNGLEE